MGAPDLDLRPPGERQPIRLGAATEDATDGLGDQPQRVIELEPALGEG
jgi:hypothetical protein